MDEMKNTPRFIQLVLASVTLTLGLTLGFKTADPAIGAGHFVYLLFITAFFIGIISIFCGFASRLLQLYTDWRHALYLSGLLLLTVSVIGLKFGASW